MTEVFSARYADIYDDLYSVKDYARETEFIMRVLNKYSRIHSILDLGCGTGNHAYHLSQAGHSVTGVDQSPSMIETAKLKLPEDTFVVGDITRLDLGKKFDAVISLFHVLSYQIRDDEVKAFFLTLKRHMHDHSLAVIDYWHGPAVMKTPPQATKKTFRHNDFEIVRHATPSRINGQPAYNVNIKVEYFREGERVQQVEENHVMRYFTGEELMKFAADAGLNVVLEGAWLEESKAPDENTWSAFMVLNAGT